MDMNSEITWQRKAQNRHWWKIDEYAFLLQWSEMGFRKGKDELF